MALLPDGLLEIMACPLCHGELVERAEQSELRCTECGRGYRVDDGIPNMLEEDALAPEPPTG